MPHPPDAEIQATGSRDSRGAHQESLGSPGKAAHVRAMFGSIAGRYDLLNRMLSMGLDAAWRREAVRVATTGKPRKVLDVATGTADVALGLKRAVPSAHVVGVDFAEPMLEIGRAKAARAGIEIALELGDGTDLPYSDGSFDVLTIAYGLRNFEDPDAGIREFRRVLRPGGKLVILEFPPPRTGPIGRMFRLYFRRALPAIGGFVSGNSSAYEYLPRSVLAFPAPGELAAKLCDAGFTEVRYKLQTFGISALHVARKPGLEPETSRASESAAEPALEPATEAASGSGHSASGAGYPASGAVHEVRGAARANMDVRSRTTAPIITAPIITASSIAARSTGARSTGFEGGKS